MTRKMALFLATAGSAAALLGALAFQYIGGLAPCELCLWQRYPHGVAIAAGLLALMTVRGKLLPMIGGLAALTTAGLGVYHTGVERAWWQGPTSCTGGGDVGNLSADQLLDQIMAAPVVMCDQVAWQMFGLSMASYNALASAVLAVLWYIAWRKS